MQNTHSQEMVNVGAPDDLGNCNALLSESVPSTPVADKAPGVIGRIISRLSLFSGAQTRKEATAESSMKRRHSSTPDVSNKRPMVSSVMHIQALQDTIVHSSSIAKPSKLVRPSRTDQTHTSKVKVTGSRDPYDIDDVEDTSPIQAPDLHECTVQDPGSRMMPNDSGLERVKTDDEPTVVKSKRGRPRLKDIAGEGVNRVMITESSNYATVRLIMG